MYMTGDNPEDPPEGLLGDPDREARTVYVGNISPDTVYERIKEVLNEVGTVVSFKMVFDKELHILKTYGFAEYKDIGDAQSAVKNMNSRELDKRNLRVDTIYRGLQMEIEDPPTQVAASDVANQQVNSISPEQMYKLLLQMKEVIGKNPVEARKILLDQPQLAYALLQAQVVMRIVPPDKAMKMIHPSATEESRREARYQPRNYLTLADLSKPEIPEKLRKEFLDEVHQENNPTISKLPTGSTRRKEQDAHEISQRQVKQETPSTIVKSEPVEEREEKNKLIQQVLELSEEQIDMLPPDQRNSVLQLKAQIQQQTRR